MKQCDVPCSVEYEEPHGRAQRRGKELVLEARKMRVEPGAFESVLFIKGRDRDECDTYCGFRPSWRESGRRCL